MIETDRLLDALLARIGCAYVLIDPGLRVLKASETAARFTATGTSDLVGRALTDELPELAERAPQIAQLLKNPQAQLRLRIKRGANTYVKVSLQRLAGDPPLVLALLEDISLLVLRTEILGRRITELESRSRSLEKTLLGSLKRAEQGGIVPRYDPGTGLYAVDFMIERLVEEEVTSRLWNRPFAVLVLQIDNLAELKTRYDLDADATETVLRLLAEQVRNHLRAMDLLGRLDESAFLALLPQTAQDGAQISAQRIAHMARAQTFGDIRDVHLSVGIAEFDLAQDDSALKIFERARAACAMPEIRDLPPAATV